MHDKHTENSSEKSVSSKQHYIPFIRVILSYTGLHLIQNNNNIRYHKEHKKNQYNCTEPPAFKSQIYRVRYQSNKKF